MILEQLKVQRYKVPTLSRSSRAGEKQNTKNEIMLCKLETLPTDLLSHVAGYLDLPNRVCIASCSKTLDHQVYQQCKSLWAVIRLERLPYRVAFHLTDGELHRLLTRCNAKEVTRILSLRGCASLRGYALDAVRGSRMLKRLDLRTDCAHGSPGRYTKVVHGLREGCCRPPGPNYKSGIFFDHQYVLGFLSSATSLHHDLARVDLDPCDFEGADGKDAAKCWLENYEKACHERMQVLGLACSNCSQRLARVSPEEGKNADDRDESRYRAYAYYARQQCSKCDVQSCCQGACPKVYKCSICLDACCGNCLDSEENFDVEEYDHVCKQCIAEGALVYCDDDDVSAEECLCSGFHDTNASCISCGLFVCTGCNHSCGSCGEHLCITCSGLL